MKSIRSYFCLIALLMHIANAQANTVTISSGEWLPYSGTSKTTAYEQFIENIFYLAGYEVVWRYPGFDFALQELDRSRTDAAFPFFLTESRLESYLVSAPIHRTRNIVLYNRFFHAQMPSLSDMSGENYRIGTVAGYSYGEFDETINNHHRVTFNSELAALEALQEGSIDLLPIEEFVWVTLVLQNYPHDYHRFAVVADISWNETLHLLMPKTSENRKIISDFDALLTEYRQHQQEGFPASRQELFHTLDAGTVTLEPTQLQPIIRGTLKDEGSSISVAIQPGTRGVVLRWPAIIFNLPEDLAAIQLLQSEVELLLLSGAHAGSVVKTALNHIRVNSQ